MVKEGSVRFGSVQIPVNTEETPFVPTSKPYREHGKILETTAFAVRENMPLLLIGETGVGKTSAIRYIAAKTNNSLRRVNANGSMTAEDFVGQMLVDEKGTYWKDGVLTECLRKGYWIVIDEINACSAEILFVLHSLLDDDHYVVLTDHPQREIVKAHPNFRLFATMNPPERYAGTKELNKALMSRFGITATLPLPPEEIEFGEISEAENVLDGTKLAQLKKFISSLRTTYGKEEIEVFVSPRDTAHIVKLYLFTGSLMEAINKTIVPRGTASEQKAILDMARIHFAENGEGDKKAGRVEVKKSKKEEEEDAMATVKKAMLSMKAMKISGGGGVSSSTLGTSGTVGWNPEAISPDDVRFS